MCPAGDGLVIKGFTPDYDKSPPCYRDPVGLACLRFTHDYGLAIIGARFRKGGEGVHCINSPTLLAVLLPPFEGSNDFIEVYHHYWSITDEVEITAVF